MRREWLLLAVLVVLAVPAYAGCPNGVQTCYSGSFNPDWFHVTLSADRPLDSRDAMSLGEEFNFMPSQSQLPASVCFFIGASNSFRSEWSKGFREAYFVAFDDERFEAPFFVTGPAQKTPTKEALFSTGFLADCSPPLYPEGVGRDNGGVARTTSFLRTGTAAQFHFRPDASRMRLRVEIWDAEGSVLVDRDNKPIAKEFVLARDPSAPRPVTPQPPPLLVGTPDENPDTPQFVLASYDGGARTELVATAATQARADTVARRMAQNAGADASEGGLLDSISTAVSDFVDGTVYAAGSVYSDLFPKNAAQVRLIRGTETLRSFAASDFKAGADGSLPWGASVRVEGLSPDEQFTIQVFLSDSVIATVDSVRGSALGNGMSFGFDPFPFSPQTTDSFVPIEVTVSRSTGAKETVSWRKMWVPFIAAVSAPASAPASQPLAISPSDVVVDVSADAPIEQMDFEGTLGSGPFHASESSSVPLTVGFSVCSSSIPEGARASSLPLEEAPAAVCVRLSENVKARFDAAKRSVTDLVSEENWKRIVEAFKAHAQSSDEPMVVPVTLSDPSGASAAGSIRLTRRASDSASLLPRPVIEPLFVRLVSFSKEGVPTALGTRAAPIGIETRTATTPVVVSPTDLQRGIGVAWGWSVTSQAPWWKKNDYYPVIYLNPQVNREAVFDGSLEQENAVEEALLAAHGDWFFDFSVDLTKKQSDDPLYNAVGPTPEPWALPSVTGARPAGFVTKRTGVGWEGVSTRIEVPGRENLFVVVIRSRSRPDAIIAMGSVPFIMPDPVTSATPASVWDPVLGTLGSPFAGSLPGTSWTIPLPWDSVLDPIHAVGRVEPVLGPSSAGASLKTETTATAPAKKLSVQWAELKAYLSDKASEWKEWVVTLATTSAMGQQIVVGESRIDAACGSLKECLARIDKSLTERFLPPKRVETVAPPAPVVVTPPVTRPPRITVYSMVSCMPCKGLAAHLVALGLKEGTDFFKKDIVADTAAARELALLQGNDDGAVPFTVIGSDTLSGFDATRLDALLRKNGWLKG